MIHEGEAAGGEVSSFLGHSLLHKEVYLGIIPLQSSTQSRYIFGSNQRWMQSSSWENTVAWYEVSPPPKKKVESDVLMIRKQNISMFDN